MDFAWAVEALRRGLKVTREAWEGDPPMHLYRVTEKPDGKYIIKMHIGTGQDFEWTPTAEQMLTVDDWEEYVEPKKKPMFGNTKLTFDENGQPHMGDTMTVEECQKVHSGEKHTFKDLCDDYLEQQKGKVQINELPFITTLEQHGGEPVCESYPALEKVWTTFYDLDIQITGTMVNKEDYPYTLCERDVLEQHGNKVVVLAEPGFSQRTVTLTLDEDCWDNARSVSADLVHRVATRYGWNMEFFISLLKSVDTTKGNYNKECHGAGSATLGQQFAEDMEYWAQENAKVMHRLHYIINQYISIVRDSVSYGTDHD